MFPVDKCICGKHQKIWYEKKEIKTYKNEKIEQIIKTKSLIQNTYVTTKRIRNAKKRIKLP